MFDLSITFIIIFYIYICSNIVAVKLLGEIYTKTNVWVNA